MGIGIVELMVGVLAVVAAMSVVTVIVLLQHRSRAAEREHDLHVRIEGDVDEDAVRGWCQRRLAVYKQPVEIEIVR